MVFSEFVPNHEFGILATIVLMIALAGSMILLPVLINYLNPQFRFSLDYKTKSSYESDFLKDLYFERRISLVQSKTVAIIEFMVIKVVHML